MAFFVIVFVLGSSRLPVSQMNSDTNYVFIPNSLSSVSAFYLVGGTAIHATSGSDTLQECFVNGQWDAQFNVFQDTFSPTNEFQIIALVDQSGNSCFYVQYTPDTNKLPYDYKGFAIGFSSEFYAAGSNVELYAVASSGKVSAFYLSVPSDLWVIYPSDLTTSPTIKYNLQSNMNLVMVGVTNCETASFSAGTGSMQQDSGVFHGAQNSFTCEHSNMAYGSPVNHGSYYSQTFTG